MSTRASLIPVLAACAGIAVYSAMDTLMKRLSIDSGAYAAMLWRSLAGTALLAPVFAARGRWPAPAVLRLHAQRSLAAGASVTLFFWGLARVPMAEGVAITFLAPLVAIFLAGAMLGEAIRPAAIRGSAIAAAGVLVIAAGEIGAGVPASALAGSAAIFAASLLYAVSLVLLRRSAQAAGPLEVAFFTSLVIALALLPAAPWLAGWPARAQWPAVGGAAALASVSGLLVAWAYARAEAQAIVPTEYTAFLWSALFGRLAFGERVSWWTVAGAALIVAGCAIALRRPPAAAPLTEAAA